MSLDKNTSDAKEGKPKKPFPWAGLLGGAGLFISLLALGVASVVFTSTPTKDNVNRAIQKVLDTVSDKEADINVDEFVTKKELAAGLQEQQKQSEVAVIKLMERRVPVYVDSQIAQKMADGTLTSQHGEPLDQQKIIDEVTANVGGLYNDMQHQTNSTKRRVDSLSAKVSSLEKATNRLIKQGYTSTAKNTPAPRKRLKEFNIVAQLKNGTLFVIDAPRKSGKDNSITLTIGEAFRSKFGRHKVEAAIKTPKGYVLHISGGYFIDQKREEFTKEELTRLQAAKRSQPQRKNAKAEEGKPAVTSTKRHSPLTTAQTNKIEMNGWYVITAIPESKEVVVYSPEIATPLRLTEGKYVQGYGSVKSIDFATGKTCFDRYCIAGNK